MNLQEATKQQILNKSKASEEGRKRFKRRFKSSVYRSTNEMNKIDMNNLFKEGILTVAVKVRGETDDYYVKVSFGKFLDELHRRMEQNGNFDIRTVTQTLISCINGDDVYFHCSCPDYCLDENTEIKLLSGEVVTVKEMCDRFTTGEDLWVYSTDDTGDFHAGHVTNVWCSGQSTEMIKVTLDNGTTISTTPNHQYMLRDGSYKRADDLTVGMSLMPLYFSYHNGYESVKSNSNTATTVFNSVYKQVANEYCADEIVDAQNRLLEDGSNSVHIHHKDFNKLNNAPSNLQPMTQLEHWKYHYTHLQESGVLDKWLQAGEKYWTTNEAKNKQAEVMRQNARTYYDTHTTEEISTHRREVGMYSNEWKQKVSDSQKSVWETYTDEEYKARCGVNAKTNHNPITKKKLSKARKEYLKEHPEAIELAKKNLELAHKVVRGVAFTDEHKQKISQTRLNFSSEKREQILEKCKATNEAKSDEQRAIEKRKSLDSKIFNIIKTLYSEGLELTEDNYDIIRKRTPHNSAPRLFKHFSNIDEVKQYFKLDEQFNHKIVSIEKILYDAPINVYDIAVDKYHNFFVNDGVMLHNCYRFNFWDTKNKMVTKGDEQYNNGKWIRNPSDNLGSGCKHILLVLSNLGWLQTVARVIVNYVIYMEQHFENMYGKIIYPAIYQAPYNKDAQTNVLDSDTLDSDNLGSINAQRRASTQFKQGNQQGYKFVSDHENQLELDLDNDEENEEQ